MVNISLVNIISEAEAKKAFSIPLVTRSPASLNNGPTSS